MAKSSYPYTALGVAAAGLGLWYATRKKKNTDPAAVSIFPGNTYKGSNPPPYNELGLSQTFDFIDGEEIDRQTDWAVYMIQDGTFIGAYRYQGGGGLTGPFTDEAEAVETTKQATA